ncbi:hypothetical protein BC834DRAFT_971611 [Gloeopeniophorella convolvens]|nr:hypothetical protein BC834DRAFT_971611 [Gloeopeniophorella convolvens]
MPKRTFDESEPSSSLPPSSSPAKRAHISTPARHSTPPSSVFSTPYTPSIYSIPADSPTNPLGLKRRANNLALPKATAFSKHIALRFQLIRDSDAPPPKSSLWAATPPDSPRSDASDSAQYADEGTYRIVQVPLTYTFRHLHMLLLFLFDGDPGAMCRGQGHLFEVHHGVAAGAPGEIARGRLRVRLSRARDPYYSARSLADLVAASSSTLDLAGGGGDGADTDADGEELELEDEEEDASWRWEGEDDFTLGHVWAVRERDPTRGIIYHHDDSSAVHITINTQRVPHRKGVGNTPFVFRAFGAPPLDPPRARSPSPPPPPRIFPRRRVPPAPELDAPSPGAAPDDFDGGLDPRAWNRTGAWARFLARAARARSPASSASPSPSPSQPGSPARGVLRRAATMPYGSEAASSSAASLPAAASWAAAAATSSPARSISLPGLTPAPARVRTRYRVARAARRLLGLTERALVSAAAEEEDADEPVRKAPGKKAKAVETKEDVRERARGKVADRGKAKGKAKGKENRVALEEDARDEEDWDPFADGEEVW